MSAQVDRDAIRRELFGTVADLPPDELRGWLVGYLDGIEDWYPTPDDPRRAMLRDTARAWLAEVEATRRAREDASLEELEAAAGIVDREHAPQLRRDRARLE